MKNQKSEIRGQRSEVRGRMTPVKFAALVFFEEFNGASGGRRAGSRKIRSLENEKKLIF